MNYRSPPRFFADLPNFRSGNNAPGFSRTVASHNDMERGLDSLLCIARLSTRPEMAIIHTVAPQYRISALRTHGQLDILTF